MQAYEKLGVFYLGRARDAAKHATTDVPLLYDSRDLLTHAVCVGMTGSGKTGLCLDLLEEAALDGIPALLIDPKGDLGNLLLTFPDLLPENFLPWVSAEEAQRKGMTREALAAETAGKWKSGLAAWDQDGERIRRLREAAEFAIYTPGSDAGRPVSILASFGPPPPEVLADGDLFRERVATAATSLLGLLGIAADPMRSREHILLSTLLDQAWRAGQGYDLAGLVRDVQKPPVGRVGVLDLETFYPAKERFELALALNNMLAAPGFNTWLEGTPLQIEELLHTASGKPRHAIFSIAHLSDSERMFFVSLLLNQTLGWMRTRPGTASLRAILYMDEIFGYLPPVANPPSKRPLLTMLKQARAYGLGVVLATQNPVDLDYKALANIGTWLIGRLQTDQDRSHVLDGLFGAGPGGEGSAKEKVEAQMAELGSRVFLMHNVHDDEPTLFESRWVMSYLAGPLSREQIKLLEGDRTPVAPSPRLQAPASSSRPVPSASVAAPAPAGGLRPVLPAGLGEVFVAAARAEEKLTYLPHLLGQARVYFRPTKAAEPIRRDVALLATMPEGGAVVDWVAAEPLAEADSVLGDEPRPGATFGELPATALTAAAQKKWPTSLQDTLVRQESLDLWLHRDSGTLSAPGEGEREFRIRLAETLRLERDRAVAAIRDKYAAKVAALDERIARAEQAIAREQAQASSQRVQAVIAAGSAVLSGLFGRRKLGSRAMSTAATAARGWSRSSKESKDVAAAQDTQGRLVEQRSALQAEIESAMSEASAKFDLGQLALEPAPVRAKKADVEVLRVVVAWLPFRRAESGQLVPARA